MELEGRGGCAPFSAVIRGLSSNFSVFTSVFSSRDPHTYSPRALFCSQSMDREAELRVTDGCHLFR